MAGNHNSGRKRLPLAVKLAKGTVEWSREGDEVTAPDFPEGTPAQPDWLSADAKACWRRLVKQLAAIPNLLSVVDRDALAIYCESFAMFLEATREINRDGITTSAVDQSGNEIKRRHPAVATRQRAIETMAKFGAKFGLSPIDRQQLRDSSKVDAIKQNPFLKLQREASTIG